MKSEVTTVTMLGNHGAIPVWLYQKKDEGLWRRFSPCFMLFGSRWKTLQILYPNASSRTQRETLANFALRIRWSARHWMLKQSLNSMVEAQSDKVISLRPQRCSPSKHGLITQQAPIWVLTISAIFCIWFEFVTQGFYMESFILEVVCL